MAVAATVEFEAGCAISQRGAPSGPSTLFVIIQGSVTVSRPAAGAAAGAAPEVLGRLGTGEHFGAKNIVDPSAPREVDVTADVAIRCLTFTVEALGEALLPLIQHSLARELATRRWILENRGRVRMEQLEAIRTIGIGSFGRWRAAMPRRSFCSTGVRVRCRLALFAPPCMTQGQAGRP